MTLSTLFDSTDLPEFSLDDASVSQDMADSLSLDELFDNFDSFVIDRPYLQN
jgi:hypothetical protein